MMRPETSAMRGMAGGRRVLVYSEGPDDAGLGKEVTSDRLRSGATRKFDALR